MRLTRLALCAAVCAASVAAGDLEITPGFKFGAGGATGAVRDVTHGSGQFGLAGTIDFKLSDKAAFTAEVGYRWFPGNQFLASTYTRTSNFPAGYTPNATYKELIQKADGSGFELGVTYRYNFLSDLYVRAGLRVGAYKVVESNTGATLLANSAGSIATVTTISHRTEKKTTSPGATVGLGYHMAPTHVVELNLSTVRLASDTVTAKSGLAVEVAYCMRF